MTLRMPFASAAAGLVLTCLPAGPIRALEEKPMPLEVSFTGAGGLKLNGTVLLPSGGRDQKFPAVLLLPGSGPTDRNGNQPPVLVTDLLKQIADRLAAEGIASLRFDKRSAHVH